MERKDQIERINEKLAEIMQFKEKFYFKAEKRKRLETDWIIPSMVKFIQTKAKSFPLPRRKLKKWLYS